MVDKVTDKKLGQGKSVEYEPWAQEYGNKPFVQRLCSQLEDILLRLNGYVHLGQGESSRNGSTSNDVLG